MGKLDQRTIHSEFNLEPRGHLLFCSAVQWLCRITLKSSTINKKQEIYCIRSLCQRMLTCFKLGNIFRLSLIFVFIFSLSQILLEAHSRPRPTDVTTNPSAACRCTVEALVGPFPSAPSCFIPAPKDPRLSWTWLRRRSKDKPVSATPSLSPTGP